MSWTNSVRKGSQTTVVSSLDRQLGNYPVGQQTWLKELALSCLVKKKKLLEGILELNEPGNAVLKGSNSPVKQAGEQNLVAAVKEKRTLC